MNRRGEILIENLVFIILNLLFLSILILFLLKQGSGSLLLEQNYAKQIALLVDASKPGMIIKINIQKGIELAKDAGILSEMVRIDENLITIKLSESGGYTYSFFNDVDVSFYPAKEEGLYAFIINEK